MTALVDESAWFRKAARYCLAVLIVSAVAVGVLGVFPSFSPIDPTDDRPRQLWAFIYTWMTVVWIDLDSRARSNIRRSFDFTFLVYVFLPLYLPYYLVKTRRGWGVPASFGFVVLFLPDAFVSLFVKFE